MKPLLPNILIQSDASGSGWRAVCNRIETRGTWSLHESSLHINCLELLAATYVIKAFTKYLSNAHVLIQIDNTSAIAYLNKMGGAFYNRPFCQQEQCSAGEILQLSARSSSRTVRCSSSALDGGECLGLPPFQIDQQMSEEDKPRRSNTVDCLSGMACAGMVPPPLQLLLSNPVFLPVQNDLLLNPLRNRHPLIINNSLPLAGWRVSGITSLLRAYQKKL